NGGGWTSEAQTAFRFAADIWETMITSPVPIVVDAKFDPMGENILGGAGPTSIRRNFTNAPQANTWYPIATANKLYGIDLEPGIADIQATFSSTYLDWHFGTGSSTGPGEINFVSVVLHELGHGLGFLGSMWVNNGSVDDECDGPAGVGCYGYLGSPMIYDRYAENGEGTALISFTNNSTNLTTQLTSGDIFIDSPAAFYANGNSRVPLYAPGSWEQGSSYAHLAESYNSTSHALMTYSIAMGETIHNPGAVTLCLFEDLGWTVSETCSTAADTPISGLAAANDGPTLLGTATQLSATISSGSNVSYEWDFGDSTSASGQNVAHQYAAPGLYTAEVTATNSVNQETAVTSVLVEEAISGLAAANDGPTRLGTATQLSATISSGSNVSYAWDFDDGESGTGAAVSHQYASPGTYTVTVTATNLVSQDSATTIVYVVEQLNWIYLPLQAKP
ncbi:MAG TPA: PKD domain-containing protein, partial [Anaerolineales bacterium]|nr:PKD domain-containing protein [Anaerolineales bacterium]